MAFGLFAGRSVKNMRVHFQVLTTSQAFLLYGPISQASWAKKLSESRTVYSSLRDYFLKYIDHPDDLQSNMDPLADDASVCC